VTLSLFDIPAADYAAPIVAPGMLGPRAFVPRDYQVEDIAAVQAAWASGRRAVLYRAATALGKAVTIGTLAAIHRPDQRVLCMIDTVKLAHQLRATFARQLGFTPGLIGGGVFDGHDRRVVICVQQSLAVKVNEEETRLEKLFAAEDIGLLLIDECESAFADVYSSLVRHLMNRNPDLDVCGCTATPLRHDGIGMGAIFDHVIEDEGPLNRGPLWGLKNGWLVPPKQYFLKCTADFSTLKVRKNEDGEKDYTDKQLAEMISTDKHLIELARGIVETAGDERSIIFCPNSTDVCDRVADYLNGAKEGCARSVHSKMTDPSGVMAAHQAGRFQFLSSCMLLVKGYDDPRLKKIFILRPTKSQRLFHQILGRALRPHDSIAKELGEIPTPEARRECIAGSCKPRADIYCLVGIKPNVRDMQIGDLLRGQLTDEELERVKAKMLDGIDIEGRENQGIDVAEAVKQVRKEMRDEREAEQRRLVQVNQAIVELTELNHGENMGQSAARRSGPYETLRRLGFRDHEMQSLSPEQAGQECRRWLAREKRRPPLCSKGQWRVLERRGFKANALEGMTKKEASAAIEEISKRERWTVKE
jgi:superfamily II DNA or RNA helicase